MFSVPINFEMFKIRPSKILSLFFILQTLKSVTFWPRRWFVYLNLGVTLSLVPLMTMRMSDFWGLETTIKWWKKNPQISKSLFPNLLLPYLFSSSPSTRLIREREVNLKAKLLSLSAMFDSDRILELIFITLSLRVMMLGF